MGLHALEPQNLVGDVSKRTFGSLVTAHAGVAVLALVQPFLGHSQAFGGFSVNAACRDEADHAAAIPADLHVLQLAPSLCRLRRRVRSFPDRGRRADGTLKIVDVLRDDRQQTALRDPHGGHALGHPQALHELTAAIPEFSLGRSGQRDHAHAVERFGVFAVAARIEKVPVEAQHQRPFRVDGGRCIQGFPQLLDVRQNGKAVPEPGDQRLRVDILAVQNTRAEEEVLLCEHDVLAGCSDLEGILVAADPREGFQRSGGDHHGDVARALFVPFGGGDAAAVAAGGLQPVLGEHQIHTAEHGLFRVLFVHSEGDAPDHFGKARDGDGVLGERHFDLGKAVAPHDRDLVIGRVAFDREHQGVAVAGKCDGLAAQTLQHPDKEPGVDDDGVLTLAFAGEADADGDLQIGGRQVHVPVAARLNEDALEHLQRRNVRRDVGRLLCRAQQLHAVCNYIHGVFPS